MATARLVFDGQCGFCTWMAWWIRRIDRRDRLDIVPLQRPGVPESIGSTERECRTALQWQGPDGSRSSGAGAANAALATAFGTRLPLHVYRVTAGFQERMYHWVSAHRERLPSVRPHCETHPADCTEGDT